MRRLVLISLSIAGFLIAVFWLSGGFEALSLRAAAFQRDFQNGMARALRNLQAGETGAVVGLLTVCFGYGFFHAAGPGHGKVVLGGYGLARPVPTLRLVGLALTSSLAQGLTAIALVSLGIGVLNLSRAGLTQAAEDWFAPASYGAIVLVGLWLIWRGLSHLRRHSLRSDRDHHHGHDHGHADHHDNTPCPTCGHHHGPTPEQVAHADGWRDWLAIIGVIAIRPCTGAIFLLILTWRFGLFPLGVLGVIAMSAGTAAITVLVAMMAVGARRATLFSLAETPRAQLVAPVLELTAGVLVASLALQLLVRSL